jgi:hypothetical protein
MFSLNDRFLNMVASEVRQKRMREAQTQRLLRQIRPRSQAKIRYYHRFLHRFGHLLENWGGALQRHAQPAADSSILSSSKPASSSG